MPLKQTLFTVGHSNRDVFDFIDILQTHQIQSIADVRSCPYSRYIPSYNRETLQKILKNAKIHYVFLGRELGVHREEEGSYSILEDGRLQVNFEKASQSRLFQEGLHRLQTGIEQMETVAQPLLKENSKHFCGFQGDSNVSYPLRYGTFGAT